jgi:hypothetical protein
VKSGNESPVIEQKFGGETNEQDAVMEGEAEENEEDESEEIMSPDGPQNRGLKG